jgi:hypothetical protein
MECEAYCASEMPLTFTLRPAKPSSSLPGSSMTACSAASRVLYTMKPYLRQTVHTKHQQCRQSAVHAASIQ